jgi:hypothetical protein
MVWERNLLNASINTSEGLYWQLRYQVKRALGVAFKNDVGMF